MAYGICLMAVIPCRKDASNLSEMVTQLLFGEIYRVVEQTDDWLKIITKSDNYDCWINKKQHYKISETEYTSLDKAPEVLANNLVQSITDVNNNVTFHIPMSAHLPTINDSHFTVAGKTFKYNGISNTPKTFNKKNILATAQQFLKTPYLWGGKTFFGIDCSGFTQVVFKINGLQLPRDASQQVNLGTALNFVEESEAGDLAFFDNEAGNIVHVGILIDNQTIIHASGEVKIDKFDHYGIFNSETKKYSHYLRVIKRIN
ncbi:MAG: C40 family peptidase [Bacteroidetes bacterium]|nr:C40 family peptidase [Bacteroidota bacterium]